MKTYTGKLTKETVGDNGIFVFGANREGRHGKGAALVALEQFGAVYGKSRGLYGQSYAIVTKDLTKRLHPSVSENEIIIEIGSLYSVASLIKDSDFYVAYSGNGVNLNGYSPQQMAEMFACCDPPENIVFEEGFSKLVEMSLCKR